MRPLICHLECMHWSPSLSSPALLPYFPCCTSSHFLEQSRLPCRADALGKGSNVLLHKVPPFHFSPLSPLLCLPGLLPVASLSSLLSLKSSTRKRCDKFKVQINEEKSLSWYKLKWKPSALTRCLKMELLCQKVTSFLCLIIMRVRYIIIVHGRKGCLII